jgi:flavin-binding protein dodecin
MSDKTVSDLKQLAETDQQGNPREEAPFGHGGPEHAYKIIELVGSSRTSIEDAIEGAIRRASSTIRHLRWFEVIQTRGHIQDGQVAHYQIVVKVGFELEG